MVINSFDLFIIACKAKGLLIKVGKALHKFLNYYCLIIINSPLAQSVYRGANNAKVVFSRLIRTRFHFIFGFVSLFKKFAYIHCFKNVILGYICIKWSLGSVGRAWCVRDSYGPDFTFYLDYFFFLSRLRTFNA